MSASQGHVGGRWGARVASALLLFSTIASAGPANWLYHVWQTDDGLPNNDITGIAQADDGAMLFATLSGVARFDGLRLARADHGAPPGGANGMCLARDGTLWLLNGSRLVGLRPGQSPRFLTLPAPVLDQHINTMLEQPAGMLWICFDNSLPLRIDLAEALATGQVSPTPLAGAGFNSAIATNNAGEIWAARPGALAHWTGKRFNNVAVLPLEKISLCAARAGGLWLGCGRQLLRDTATGCVEVARLPAGPPGSRASALLEDRQGRIWFGTYGDGLYVWDGKDCTRVALPNHDIWSLLEDREGNLWAGTGGGGVCRVRPRMLMLLDEADGPVNQTPRSLCVDTRGDLWVALQTGKLWRRHAGRWQPLEDRRDWPAANATCVAAGTNGQCWIGTSDGGLVRWDGQRFEDVPLPPPAARQGRIRAVLAARDGTVWIGRGATLLRGQPGHWQELAVLDYTNDVRVLTEDARGQVWVGTRDGVLLRAAGTNLVVCTPPELAGHGAVRTLLGTPEGALWIGTSIGLARLQNGQCRLLTTAQGLRHNIVSQLILGPHGRLWAAGNRGIFSVGLDELTDVVEGRATTCQCSAFGSGEGAPGLQANSGYTPNALLAPDGRLWFSTRTGLAIADPTFCGANTNPPPVAIAAMSVNGKSIHLPQPKVIQVEPGPAEIRFALSAMSYVAPENVRLRHRLEGADRDWQETPADRTLAYPHLPPGNYTLRVRAANNDGVWSAHDATLAFSVRPFFYQRTGLQAAAAATGLLAVLLAAGFAILRRKAVAAEKQALAALRTSEEKYRNLIENSREAIYVVQHDRIQFANRAAVQMAHQELLNTSIQDLVPPEDRALTAQHHQSLLAGALLDSQKEYRLRDTGAGVRWLAVNAVRIQWNGQPATLNFGSDITERKRVEEALQHSKEDWENIFQAIGQPTAILDPQYGLLAANRALLQASGKTLAELRGLKCWEVFHGGVNTGPIPDCPMERALHSGHQEVAEVELQALGGIYLLSCTPVMNAAGQVEKVIHIATNITEFKRLQQAFLQAQKMETVGKLAGGVAHDFNNILQTILGYSEFLLKSTPTTDERHRDLLEIQRSGLRAATLTRQLLAFSRKQMLMPRIHDLNEIVGNLAKMLTRLLGENIQLKLDLAADLAPVKVDSGQMDQVLTNLAVNARDAMPQGGLLSLRTANLQLNEADLPFHPEGRAGRFVCLSVTDNGAGMSRATRGHLFEPFFTTKEPGKGTGLGLSTVYGIVKQHDGWITVYSEPGHGTTFRIYLPALDAELVVAPPAGSTLATPPTLGHGERVLLIEDDPLVRRMTQQMLNQCGYRAIAVATCAEAQTAFNSLIGLVLSDVMLPDGNGLDLVRQFQQQRPDLRCILTSGYADIHERWPEIEQKRWPFLIKPHNQADLLRALAAALAGT